MIRLILLTITFAALVSCSFSKNQSDKNNSDIIENSTTNTKELSSRQKEAFQLAYESDLRKVKSKLTLLAKEDLNSTNEQAKSLMDILVSIGDIDRLNLFLNAGLSIYSGDKDLLAKIETNQKTEAKRYLLRLSKMAATALPASAPLDGVEEKISSVHQQNINKIVEFLKDKKTGSAVLYAKNADLSCEILVPALILDSLHLENRLAPSNISQFLKITGCQNSLSLKETQALYFLETQRQFQSRFDDQSLLSFLSLNLKSIEAMIPLGESEIKVSPIYLMKVSHCLFYLDNIKTGYLASGNDENGDPKKIGTCSSFEGDFDPDNADTSNLVQTPFELVMTKENHEAIAIQHLGPQPEPLDTFDRQVINYMFGYEGSKQEWLDSLSNILSDDFGSGM